MIHVKAIAAGLAIMLFMVGVIWLIAKYPFAGFSLLALVAAYCIGRGAVEMLPKRWQS